MDGVKEWISVDDKLPDRLAEGFDGPAYSEEVLISNMGHYHLAFFDFHLRVWHVNVDLSLPWARVTHWTLLPERPKYSLNKNRKTGLVIAGRL